MAEPSERVVVWSRAGRGFPWLRYAEFEDEAEYERLRPFFTSGEYLLNADRPPLGAAADFTVEGRSRPVVRLSPEDRAPIRRCRDPRA